MSWQATLSGHVGSMEAERDLLLKLKKLLNELNSEVSVVSLATVTTTNHGRVDLMATKTEALGIVTVDAEEDEVDEDKKKAEEDSVKFPMDDASDDARDARLRVGHEGSDSDSDKNKDSTTSSSSKTDSSLKSDSSTTSKTDEPKSVRSLDDIKSSGKAGTTDKGSTPKR